VAVRALVAREPRARRLTEHEQRAAPVVDLPAVARWRIATSQDVLEAALDPGVVALGDRATRAGRPVAVERREDLRAVDQVTNVVAVRVGRCPPPGVDLDVRDLHVPAN